MHGLFVIPHFGEVDLWPEFDIPRGSKCNMYQFPCGLYSSKNSGSPRISSYFDYDAVRTLNNNEQSVNKRRLLVVIQFKVDVESPSSCVLRS